MYLCLISNSSNRRSKGWFDLFRLLFFPNSGPLSVNTSLNFTKLYQDTGFKKLFIKNPDANKKSSSPFQPPQLPGSVKKTTKKAALKDKILLGVYDFVTAIKTVKINSASNNGTALPGYTGSSGFFGTWSSKNTHDGSYRTLISVAAWVPPPDNSTARARLQAR